MEQTARPQNTVGYLIVEARTGANALPVEQAVVTIESTRGTGTVKLTLETDNSGRTERLSLPTVSRTLSESPGTPQPYSTYEITVVADGYYPFFAYDVPIFNGVTTLQRANLIALAFYESDTVYPRGNTSVENIEPFQENGQ